MRAASLTRLVMAAVACSTLALPASAAAQWHAIATADRSSSGWENARRRGLSARLPRGRAARRRRRAPQPRVQRAEPSRVSRRRQRLRPQRRFARPLSRRVSPRLHRGLPHRLPRRSLGSQRPLEQRHLEPRRISRPGPGARVQRRLPQGRRGPARQPPVRAGAIQGSAAGHGAGLRRRLRLARALHVQLPRRLPSRLRGRLPQRLRATLARVGRRTAVRADVQASRAYRRPGDEDSGVGPSGWARPAALLLRLESFSSPFEVLPPTCRYRLGVRTRGSQPRDRGSNPRTGTILRSPASVSEPRIASQASSHRKIGAIRLEGR